MSSYHNAEFDQKCFIIFYFGIRRRVEEDSAQLYPRTYMVLCVMWLSHVSRHYSRCAGPGVSDLPAAAICAAHADRFTRPTLFIARTDNTMHSLMLYIITFLRLTYLAFLNLEGTICVTTVSNHRVISDENAGVRVLIGEGLTPIR